MKPGICFRRESNPQLQREWHFVFNNFGIVDVWERGHSGDDPNVGYPLTGIETAAELPDRPLVVLQPETGQRVKGVENLLDFEHPDDAIYLFGASDINLTDEDDLGGRDPDHLVFIPTHSAQMFAPSAAYVTLYDRYVKRGGWD